MQVAPDKAEIRLTIRHNAATAEQATDTIYRQGRELLAFLAEKDIGNDDIEAAQINKEATYKDYNDRTITGYSATQPILIKLNSLQHYSAIMDYLFRQPHIFSIDGQFDSHKRVEYEQQLQLQASRDARSTAEGLAAAQGVKLSSVFAITEASGWQHLPENFGFGGGSFQYGAQNKMSAAEDSSASSLVLPKQINLSKTVNVIYKIEP